MKMFLHNTSNIQTTLSSPYIPDKTSHHMLLTKTVRNHNKRICKPAKSCNTPLQHRIRTKKNLYHRSLKENSNLKTMSPSSFQGLEQESKLGLSPSMEEENASSKSDNLTSQTINQKTTQQTSYFNDICEYLQEKQLRYLPKMMLASDHQSCNNRDRLVIWVLQVSQALRLKTETFFLSVNILDRYFGLQVVKDQEMVALAITALYMAAKYQEITIPQLKCLLHMVPQELFLNSHQILQLESKVITTLDFDLGYVSPIIFLDILMSQCDWELEAKQKVYATAKELICSSETHRHSSSKIAYQSLRRLPLF